ncbi:GDSL esterase/lipase At1g29670-like isoform X2 [Juglans regia]|uniref:GDSL esterase/lipase At1g29670-like isoform X2 n=1 Tax=Juglans regia TaxID=51240 RepID=A0A6P9DTS0_JUGRE|nr:GDSL esterase/lipase At1g29670-like isoform X2 [Juglans regia]
MACSLKISSWKLLIVFLLASNSQHDDLYYADAKPQVPCFFIFGDSIADNGNNNNLNTTIKINYLPYGIDFPEGATGRFTNGRTPMDFLAEFMGFDHYIPPFATANGSDILEGVNYASGGAGIRNESGQFGTLHKYGARKVAVYGQDMPRCTLFLKSICAFNTASCMAYMTNAITLFNDGLKPMVAGLSHSLPDANFIYINYTGIMTSIFNSQGFNKNINFPCCQVTGTGNIFPLNCNRHGYVCRNRSQYAFFDAVHPTEAVYELQTRRTYRAESPTDSYPFDIEHLAKL